MKTRILLITLSILALVSFGAARVTKENPKSSKESNTVNMAHAPIGGLVAEEK
jgi:hypothetical protein